MDDTLCQSCHKVTTRVCPRCKAVGVRVGYCSEEHQRVMWPTHELICGKILTEPCCYGPPMLCEEFIPISLTLRSDVFFDNNPQAPNKSGKTVLEALGGEPGGWMPMVDKKQPTEVWMLPSGWTSNFLIIWMIISPPNEETSLPRHFYRYLEGLCRSFQLEGLGSTPPINPLLYGRRRRSLLPFIHLAKSFSKLHPDLRDHAAGIDYIHSSVRYATVAYEAKERRVKMGDRQERELRSRVTKAAADLVGKRGSIEGVGNEAYNSILVSVPFQARHWGWDVREIRVQ